MSSKAIILAGGLGTRLREVLSDVPKPLAPVNGIPYLAYMVNMLYRKGIHDIVIAAGYKAEQFDTFIADQQDALPGLKLALVVEPEPLGTGGAVRYCYEQHPAKHYYIFNGDSYCDFRFSKLRDTAFERGAAMVVAQVNDISRYGEVAVTASGRITSFYEKQPMQRSGWINAGIYSIPASVIAAMPTNQSFSLEQEVLPLLVKSGLYAVKAIGPFIDIGIPEDYRQFTVNPSHYFPVLPQWCGIKAAG